MMVFTTIIMENNGLEWLIRVTQNGPITSQVVIITGKWLTMLVSGMVSNS